MKVKKYIVNDLKEAMKRIKEDLGNDAIILSTRRVKKGGFLGIGGKTFFEVTAVVEDKESNSEQSKTREDIYRLQEILIKNRLSKTEDAEKSGKEVEKEIENIKTMIHDIRNMMISGKRVELPQGIGFIERGLKIQEIDEEVVMKIVEYLRVTFGDVDVKSSDIKEKLSEYLKPFIKTEEVDLAGKVIFVGPTGVGKTTTLAKLAAKLKIEQKKKIAVVTFDTYRIAAADQLKTYAHILDIPIRVVYTPQEAEMELNALIPSYEAILMDTAGRSQRNEIQMGELRALVNSIKPDKILLVISMNYKYSDVKDVLDRFKEIGPTHVVLSKMDETGSYGLFVNVPYYSDIPIAFVTNGQRVPEDIFVANSVELSNILAKEVLRYAGTG